MTRIALDALNAMPEAAFVSALGNMVEGAPWAARKAAASRPFAGLRDLHAALRRAVESAPAERRLALIRGHPDLAGKLALADELGAESRAEQSGAGLDRLSGPELAEFTRLNAAYAAAFGFPFVICVRRRTRDAILAEFERRLGNDPAPERDAALAEVMRIAALRIDDAVQGPDPLPVHGRLSTHVLDTHAGRPAEGVGIVLVERARLGEARVVARAVTNADGRTDAPLIAGRPIPIGRYELRFALGAYFARRVAGLAEPPFLDQVPVRFAMTEAEGHYHIPLLASPWSYTTYRGS